MTIQEVCERIELQPAFAAEVINAAEEIDFEAVRPLLDKYKNMDTSAAALKELKAALEPDERNIKLLACTLKCAAEQYENFVKMGISDKIYNDTMKCFSRFAGECFVRTGEYAFDRDFWTTRHIGMALFRLGELEFEMSTEDGEKVINVHVPSDTKMSDEEVDASIAQSRAFFAEHYPEYKDVEYLCESWLLTPVLKKFLNENSKIVRFQNRFDIYKENMEDTSFTEWLYHTLEYKPEEFAEDTSLQRAVKQYVLSGGKVGCGYGKLR